MDMKSAVQSIVIGKPVLCEFHTTLSTIVNYGPTMYSNRVTVYSNRVTVGLQFMQMFVVLAAMCQCTV